MGMKTNNVNQATNIELEMHGRYNTTQEILDTAAQELKRRKEVQDVKDSELDIATKQKAQEDSKTSNAVAEKRLTEQNKNRQACESEEKDGERADRSKQEAPGEVGRGRASPEGVRRAAAEGARAVLHVLHLGGWRRPTLTARQLGLGVGDHPARLSDAPVQYCLLNSFV